MHEENARDPSDRAGPGDPAVFYATGFIVWLPVSLAAGAVGSWLGVFVQRYFAPLFVFPALLGVAFGLVSVGLLRLTRFAHRPTAIAGTALATLVLCLGQHYWGYREAREQALEFQSQVRTAARKHILEKKAQNSKSADIFEPLAEQDLVHVPDSVIDYLRAEAAHARAMHARGRGGAKSWLSWYFDAALTLVACMVCVWAGLRTTYCNRCRNWFRTTRTGWLEPAIAVKFIHEHRPRAATGQGRARFTLSECASGCNACSLTIDWPAEPSLQLTLWPDVAARMRLIEIVSQKQRPAAKTRNRGETTRVAAPPQE